MLRNQRSLVNAQQLARLRRVEVALPVKRTTLQERKVYFVGASKVAANKGK